MRKKENRDPSDKLRNCKDRKNQKSSRLAIILRNKCLETFCSIYKKTSATMYFANKVDEFVI